MARLIDVEVPANFGVLSYQLFPSRELSFFNHFLLCSKGLIVFTVRQPDITFDPLRQILIGGKCSFDHSSFFLLQ